jgi:signal transduction histidine kinase
MMRLRVWRSKHADVALAVGLTAIGIVENLDASRIVMVLDALPTLLLAFRRRAAVAVAVAFGTGNLLTQLIVERTTRENDALAPIAALLIALYSTGAFVPDLRLAVPAGAWMAGTAFIDLFLGHAHDSFWPFEVFMMVAAWSAGRILRSRSRELEEQQEVRAGMAVAAERARLARELHDVIAHAVSVMVVQAQGAAAVLERDPTATKRALTSIESTGRQVIVELRRLLGILRERDGSVPVVAQSGLRDIDDLVEPMRRADLRVDVKVEGTPVDLPASLELSAFRVLQEGLTNVLKHAGAHSVWLAIRYMEDAVELEVVDDGRGPSTQRSPGYGLVGVRERVQLFGGSVEAGSRREGGYRLWARLPTDNGKR